MKHRITGRNLYDKFKPAPTGKMNHYQYQSGNTTSGPSKGYPQFLGQLRSTNVLTAQNTWNNIQFQNSRIPSICIKGCMCNEYCHLNLFKSEYLSAKEKMVLISIKEDLAVNKIRMHFEASALKFESERSNKENLKPSECCSYKLPVSESIDSGNKDLGSMDSLLDDALSAIGECNRKRASILLPKDLNDIALDHTLFADIGHLDINTFIQMYSQNMYPKN